MSAKVKKRIALPAGLYSVFTAAALLTVFFVLSLIPRSAAASDVTIDSEPFKTVGSIVSFGRYEQDDVAGNGPEAIEWIVLDVQDGKALLTSRYGLDGIAYHDHETTAITWEQCSARSYLNGEFLQIAFSEAEQAAILTTTVDNSAAQGNSGWITYGGNNTEDKIFLLSYAEAEEYLDGSIFETNNLKARLAPTAHALKDVWISDTNRTADGDLACWWRLRSPGATQYSSAVVKSTGVVYYMNVTNDDGCTRPTLWVDLGADIF